MNYSPAKNIQEAEINVRSFLMNEYPSGGSARTAGAHYHLNRVFSSREYLWEMQFIGQMETRGYLIRPQFSGEGHTLTPDGVDWLKNKLIKTDISSSEFNLEIFAPIKNLHNDFIEEFWTLLTEAKNCYDTKLYIATCVMLGAAAESIILVIGRIKIGPEKANQINSEAMGLMNLYTEINKNWPLYIKRDIGNWLSNLKRYRDDAAHPQNAKEKSNPIYSNQSKTSLINLCEFVRANWSKIISK